jgi:hypothetical protein
MDVTDRGCGVARKSSAGEAATLKKGMPASTAMGFHHGGVAVAVPRWGVSGSGIGENAIDDEDPPTSGDINLSELT